VILATNDVHECSAVFAIGRARTSLRDTQSIVFRERLTLYEVTVRRLHRAVVQALYEMDELHVRLDVLAASSDIIGFERLRRHHFAKLVAEPVLNGHRE
jgi:hypothetical protein